MKKVRAKKHLGQHFLKDLTIAEQIASALPALNKEEKILEIGPGMGVLTTFLDQKHPENLFVIDLDAESIVYLNQKFSNLSNRKAIIYGDFLKEQIKELTSVDYHIIGNFPYNISSQILFKVWENNANIPSVVGMFQKEVAERVCAGPGSKKYGILSVLLQVYYDCEYLFTVSQDVFDPPPKVLSGVIRLTKKKNPVSLPVSEKVFKQIVKAAFNQRRKTLRNSLKSLYNEKVPAEYTSLRPEQLAVEDFIKLATAITQQ